MVLGIDQLCVNDANRRLPYYPGAVQLEADSNGFRVRGIGTSVEVLSSEDEAAAVEAWYEQNMIRLLNSGRQRGLNNINVVVEENEAGQSQIVYISQCVM
jgi:fumarate hydratase class II